MSRQVIFHAYPMPPSDNALYATITRGRRPIRIKTREYHAYEVEVANWVRLYWNQVQDARRELAGKLLEVRADFYFQRQRVYCLDGKPKRMDVANRLAALHDTLSKALGIDDSYFFKVSAQKFARDDGQAFVMVHILDYDRDPTTS